MSTGNQLLYLKLAEALSQPSKAYRAAQAGLDIPKQAIEGYKYGADFGDSLRKRKLAQSSLTEALGGRIPDGLEGFGDLSVEAAGDLAKPISAIADLQKANTGDNWLAKFKMQQDATNERQKDRQDFIRSMVGAKGNKEAVNQAKNAVQGLGYVDDLYGEIDKLNDTQKALASNDLTGKLFPSINALKKNVRRTAGFSEGGKNLTANELNIVVDSFEPTVFDDPKSRVLKKKIAKDYYSGTIDLFDAAKLLGPAGAKLQEIAAKQKQRAAMGDSLLRNEATGGDPELNDVFASEGL
jgi:hypothetical protein